MKLVTPEGVEQFSVSLPGRFQWDTRLHFNPEDHRIYYFDMDRHSVTRADSSGAEVYFQFDSNVRNVFLAINQGGTIYAAVTTTTTPRIVDITDPTALATTWRGLNERPFWLDIACTRNGNLFAAFGPYYQHVLQIDTVEGTGHSIVPISNDRQSMGFVDPQGFAVMNTGEVVLSAPGLLLLFQQE